MEKVLRNWNEKVIIRNNTKIHQTSREFELMENEPLEEVAARLTPERLAHPLLNSFLFGRGGCSPVLQISGDGGCCISAAYTS